MNEITIEEQIRRLIAEMSGQQIEAIDLASPVADCGLDSLGLVLFRETCERMFQVGIPDAAWLGLKNLAQLRDHIVSRQVALRPAQAPSQVVAPPPASEPSRRRLGHFSPEDFAESLEVGMPLTGINNLAESPLLKFLGDHRWAHLGAFTGVPSKQIADEEGNRLYATFFYVEVAFPENRPMAAYGENDRVMLVSNMKRFGGSLLDGVTCLLPEGAGSPGRAAVFESPIQAAAAGVPAVRLSNIFVSQFGGAEWLKKSRPSNPGFDRIPEMALAPDSYSMVKRAGEEGQFQLPDATYIAMTEGPAEWQYQLLPDRDVNGAGLVYFANYPIFLDMAERAALVSARLGLSDDLVNRRTLVRRRSGYLNNASWKDQVIVETRVWVQNPFLTGAPAPELAPVRLFSNQRMHRKSDGRLMLVSSAEKILFGRAIEETDFFSRLSQGPP
jgi:probable biosynthetic protein (TIGR04098 family)